MAWKITKKALELKIHPILRADNVENKTDAIGPKLFFNRYYYYDIGKLKKQQRGY
ncbi:hypothetical protein [Maribacter antarcticus]|uniref:hypothetical protein n=1 Tax=Maribacter antarcticus TaxID=505250 RepID=UPI0012EBB054|nr:hypothetical protein [Maribacter antarcticus]